MEPTRQQLKKVLAALERKPKLFSALFHHLVDNYTFVSRWEDHTLTSSRFLSYESEPVGSVIKVEDAWAWQVSVDAANIDYEGTEPDRETAKAKVDALLRDEGWILG